MDNADTIGISAPRFPKWLNYLQQHRSLLGEHPCEDFAEAFLAENHGPFEELIQTLYVPSSSWLHDELIIAPIRSIAQRSDEPFRQNVQRLVELLNRDSIVGKYDRQRMRGAAMLLSRYSQCEDRPQHVELQTLALDLIGNPWLDQPKWDALVRTADNKPDDEARRMVDRWLKLRLIRDFFDLLSSDPKAARDRFSYWTQKEPYISDMWFAIGHNIRKRSNPRLREFERHAQGRLFEMLSSQQADTAFIMRIGNKLVIEFGNMNNACYFYSWHRPPSHFRGICENPSSAERRKLDDLKEMGSVDIRLDHKPGWQQRFNEYLRADLRDIRAPMRASAAQEPVISSAQPSAESTVHKQSTAPASKEAWQRYCEAREIPFVDRRTDGGAVQLLDPMIDRVTANVLRNFGFVFSTDAGWSLR